MYKRGPTVLHVCERCSAALVNEFAEEIRRKHLDWLDRPDSNPLDYRSVRPGKHEDWYALWEKKTAALKKSPCYTVSLTNECGEGSLLCEACVASLEQYVRDVDRMLVEVGSVLS